MMLGAFEKKIHCWKFPRLLCSFFLHCCGPICFQTDLARNRQLQLDKAIILREVFFYALSLIILMIAVSDRRPVEDDESGVDHIFISLVGGCTLFAGYLVYVVVLAYFDRIMALVMGRTVTCLEVPLESIPPEDPESSPPSSSSTTSSKEAPLRPVAKLPFVRHVSREPSINFKANLTKGPELNEIQIEEFYTSRSGSSLGDHSDYSAMLATLQATNSGKWSVVDEETGKIEIERSVDGSEHAKQRIRKTLCLCEFVVDEEIPQPSALFGLTDLYREEQEGSFSCFLWQQSSFYNKARVSFNAWQLRWFTFYPDRFISVPDRAYQNHAVSYFLPYRIEIDDSHLLVKLYAKNGNQNRECEPNNFLFFIHLERRLCLNSHSDLLLFCVFRFICQIFSWPHR